MIARLRAIWRQLGRGSPEARTAGPARTGTLPDHAWLPLDITPDDPLNAFFLSAPGVAEIDKLPAHSPAVRALREAGVKLVVPLVSQGELVGLLNLGPRRSEQDYSTDDRTLLNNLATQAAPAVRVAQLVHQQQEVVLARERLEQEMRVARQIQLSLLPKEMPSLGGWQIAAHYQPARAVGGDFYDLLLLPDGHLLILIGDVTDKGVPAALLMATTLSALRGAARRLVSPGPVLERVNELILPEIPPNMFVTCLCILLDPATGRMRFANAGQDLPLRRHDGGVDELRATGMPLGLMPGMRYEEKEAMLRPGDTLLLFSDGLIEAHDSSRQMFGRQRVAALLQEHAGGPPLIDLLVDELARFTSGGWEHEDDVTLVVLQRRADAAMPAAPPSLDAATLQALWDGPWETLATHSIPSARGNERQAIAEVAAVIDGLLPRPRLERLKTAVGEATMNAMEHGNHFRADLPVALQILRSAAAVKVRITDQGGGQPYVVPSEPDLDAKLAGLQTSRGWGLFLITHMVDGVRSHTENASHTIELLLALGEAGDDHTEP